MTDLEYLEDNKDRLEHFVALGAVQPYIWVNGRGELEDLRKVHSRVRLKNLFLWMTVHSTHETPYHKTEQYQYVKRARERLEKREGVALNALRRKNRNG